MKEVADNVCKSGKTKLERLAELESASHRLEGEQLPHTPQALSIIGWNLKILLLQRQTQFQLHNWRRGTTNRVVLWADYRPDVIGGRKGYEPL